MKRIFCLLIASIITLAVFSVPSFVTHAVVGSSAGPQDVNHTIRGMSVTYSFDVPMHWRPQMRVNRSVLVNHPEIEERLVFTYQPSNAALAPSFMFELLVFRRGQWSERANHTFLTETDTHVFAVRSASSNPYVFGTDRLIFGNWLREATNPAFLINYISLPTGGDTVVRNTVSVNGARLTSPSHTNNFRVVSVPLREVAEALGYTVVWDSRTGNVTLSSPTFHTTLGPDINVRQRYNITNIDGLSYVPTMFFLQVLGCNVEIDEFSNVRITR